MGRKRASGSTLPFGRLIALFVLLSVVPLAVLAFSSIKLATDALTNEVRSKLLSSAEVSATAVQSELDGLTEVVDSYAHRPSLIRALTTPGGYDRRKFSFHLRQLKNSRPGIATAGVVRPDGRLIEVIPPTPSIVGKDFSFRDWYRGVTARQSPYVSEAFEAQSRDHPQVVAVSALVRAPDGKGRPGKVIAILIAAYGLDAIQHLVDGFAASQGVQLTVTDQRGVLIAAPGGGIVGLNSRRSDSGVAAALRGESGVMTRKEGGEDALSAYAPVPELGWTVSASVPERVALAPVGKLRSTVLAVSSLLGLVLLAGFVVLVLGLRALRRAQKQAAHASRLDAQLAAIVQGSDDAILSKTHEGVITSWNPAAERLYGYAADEVIGRPVGFLIPAHLEGEEREILATAFAGKRLDHYETERVRKDGRTIEVAVTVSPIADENGNFIAASTIARDITERKRSEQAVRSAKEDAERANAAKSQFLSRMSHELRTPLNAVLGFGQLLAMDDLAAEQKDNVRQILKAGQHLLGLINEVLDISRIEAGQLTLSVEPVSVEEIVSDIIDLLRPLAADRRILLSSERGPEGLSVFADRQRLKQILLNLVSNGIKYNRDGGSVCVRVVPGEKTARIEVADSGSGIAPDQIDRLFTPFERLGADQTTVEGTGLGLALSKGLAEAMGGALGVESRFGEGSTFWVDLPTAEEQMEQIERIDAAPAVRVGDGEACTVLYVEDNLSNLRLVERILARRGDVKLLSAMQGGLGLDLAREHSPDLILLDLHLSDLPGSEVLARLRAEPETRDIPIVVLSADATPGQIQKLLAQGAADYLTKPIDVERFLAVMNEQLVTGNGRPTAGPAPLDDRTTSASTAPRTKSSSGT